MTLVEIIAANAGWAWIVAGLVMLGLELALPGGFLLWLGLSGIFTGVIALVQPLGWPLQWLIFGVLSLLTILIWLRLPRHRDAPADSPYLNRRAESFVGHEAVLDQPIAGGFGRLALGDTIWRIAGPDLPAGRRIRIIGAEGPVLRVEAAGEP